MSVSHVPKVIFICLLVSSLSTSAAAIEGPADENPKGVEVTLGWKGLQFETNDKTFKFKIGGRIHFDAAGHPGNLPNDPSGFGSVDPTDGVEIRRGRISLSGTIFENWKFLSQIDFADDEVAVKDMLISYNGFDWGRFTLGNQKQPYSEAIEMSSNDLPFIERGVDNDLIVPYTDRALGLRFDGHGKIWMVAAGVYGDGIDPTETLDEGWGVAGRAVIAPILNENSVLHLGFRSAYRVPDEDKSTSRSRRVRTETTHFSSLYISNTGVIRDLDSVVLYGPEAAFAWGPFSIFGEYNRAYFKVDAGMPNLNFQSGHLAATYSLTGESRAASYVLKDGEFKRLEPKNNFSLKEGTWGAFELAVRYAYVDVTNKNVRGGQEGRISTGINWYLNPAVRMLLDWTRVVNAKNGGIITNSAKGLDIISYRFQLTF